MKTRVLLAIATIGILLAAYAQPRLSGLFIGPNPSTTNITLEGDGAATIKGDIILPEKADHSETPGAGYGYIWVKNTTPSALMYTNDAGTDKSLSDTAVTTDGIEQLAATTSAELAGVISDESGSGALVFANSPTLVTPALGTPASGTLTNATGLPLAGIVSQTEARILGRAVGAGTGAVTALTVDQVVQFLYRKTTLTSGTTPAWTCTDGIKFKLTLAHNATIQAATGTPFDGQPAEFLIIQDGSSAYTCAFATGSSKTFIAGDDFSDTIPAVSSTLSSKSYYKFEYDSGADRFVLMATSVS